MDRSCQHAVVSTSSSTSNSSSSSSTSTSTSSSTQFSECETRSPRPLGYASLRPELLSNEIKSMPACSLHGKGQLLQESSGSTCQ